MDDDVGRAVRAFSEAVAAGHIVDVIHQRGAGGTGKDVVFGPVTGDHQDLEVVGLSLEKAAGDVEDVDGSVVGVPANFAARFDVNMLIRGSGAGAVDGDGAVLGVAARECGAEEVESAIFVSGEEGDDAGLEGNGGIGGGESESGGDGLMAT